MSRSLVENISTPSPPKKDKIRVIISKTGANGWTVFHIHNSGPVTDPQFLNLRLATPKQKRKIK